MKTNSMWRLIEIIQMISRDCVDMHYSNGYLNTAVYSTNCVVQTVLKIMTNDADSLH